MTFFQALSDYKGKNSPFSTDVYIRHISKDNAVKCLNNYDLVPFHLSKPMATHSIANGYPDMQYFTHARGIKISDPYEIIPGTFHIYKNSIMYSPFVKEVFHEYDFDKYGTCDYYTTETMSDILEKLTTLKKYKKLLLHTGITREGYQINNTFVAVSRLEFLEYANDAEKAKTLEYMVK
jgi:hypothetical protein